ncbi:MAG: hypothetical protein ACK5KP_10150 [Paludibacteraceae bacterium]
MKKSILLTIASCAGLLIAFSSCKKEEEPLGSVKLDPATVQTTYGNKLTLTPVYEAGQASSFSYEWTSSADSIVSVKAGQGGLGEIQALRVGEATIYYKGYDTKDKNKTLKLTASTKVSVSARSSIFGNVFFRKGEPKTTLEGLGVGVLNTDQSTATLLVYDRTPDAVNKVEKTVFELADNKLVATYAYIQDTPSNRESATQFIEERFKYTGTVIPPFTVYNAGVTTLYAVGTKAGLFLGVDPGNGISGLGIKFW